LGNRIRKILKYKWKKINIKITFKSISEIIRAELVFMGVGRNIGGEEKTSTLHISQTERLI
jgi:hypothetical protein